MDNYVFKCMPFLFGIITVSKRLQFVTADVTFTSSSVAVAENSPLELTCTYTGTQIAELFTMEVGDDVEGSLIPVVPDCRLFAMQTDTTLYEYSCPTTKQLKWTVKRVTRANEGDTWKCTVSTTTDGSTSATHTISVHVPVQNVTMTSPTGGVVAVNENTETVFVCTTAGLPAPTVRWYKDERTSATTDDIEITTFATVTTSNTHDKLVSATSTLKYSPKRADNGFRIYCTASISGSTVTSVRKPQLNVYYSPDGLPKIQSFSNGDTYKIIETQAGTLSCSVKGGNPLATLSWICYNSGPASAIVDTTVTRNVTWTAVRNQDRPCTCQSSHAVAGAQTTTVNVQIMYPPDQPMFKINGNTVSGPISFIEVKSREIVCEGNGKPTPNIYSWSKAGKTVSSGNTLTFDSVQKQDVGQYSCTVQNTMNPTTEGQQNGTNTSVVNVIVLYPPVVGQLTNNIITEGSDLNVSCPVLQGNPPDTTFKWTRNDSMVWNQQILYKRNFTKHDDMIYTCTVQNTMRPTGASQQHGEDSGSFLLNVLYKSAVTFYINGYEGSKSVTVNEHADVKFTCAINSTSASSIKLMYDNSVLTEELNTNSLSFDLSNTACLQGGVYTCEGNNEHELTSNKNMSLLVRCSPRPLHQIKHNTTSSRHNSVTLGFTALAYPEPGPTGFTWEKEVGIRWTPLLSNADLHISSSGVQTNLTILNVSQTDYGQYRITVTNDVGKYQQYLFLTELELHKEKDDQEMNGDDTNNDVLIGVTLGLFSAGLAIYAIVVTIRVVFLKRKTVNSGKQSKQKSTKQRTYINLPLKKLETAEGAGIECIQNETDASNDRMEESENQYTDLKPVSENDRSTYDVIQPRK